MKHKSASRKPAKPNPEKEPAAYEFFTSEAEVMEWCEGHAIELFRELDEAEAKADAERRQRKR